MVPKPATHHTPRPATFGKGRRRVLALAAGLMAAFGGTPPARAAHNAFNNPEPVHVGVLNDGDADGDAAPTIATTAIATSTAIVGYTELEPILVVVNRAFGQSAIRAHGGPAGLVSDNGGTGLSANGGDHSANNGLAGPGVFGGGGTATGQGGLGGTGVFGAGGPGSGAINGGTGGPGVAAIGGSAFFAGPGVRALGGAGFNSTDGYGVDATNTSTVRATIRATNSGSTYAVFGQSSTGVGIRGISFGASTAGVEGVAAAAGPGVWGFTSSGHAVLGNSATGNGGVFSSSTGYGLSASTTSGAVGVFAKSPAFAFAGQGSLSITGTGHFGAGIVVSNRMADGSLRGASAMTSAEPVVEDFGRARLDNGSARVEIDPLFAQFARLADYDVFLVPRGDCNGLYVTNLSPAGFDIRELRGGTSTLDVSYRVVAKRAGGSLAGRFARVPEPPPAPSFPAMPTIPTSMEPVDSNDSIVRSAPIAPRVHTSLSSERAPASRRR
jgi:hypothetical protein